MQAIILAAGRGTRMGELVKEKPKHLLEIDGKSILAHTLFVMPREVLEVIIVVGHKGEVIKQEIGDRFEDKRIVYVTQSDLLGTAHALWLTKDLLDGKFLVLGGDDWYRKEDLEKISVDSPAIGVQVTTDSIKMAVKLENGYYAGLYDAVGAERIKYKATGVFALDKEIFGYEPVKLKSGELGLPQTVALMAKNRKIKAVDMPGWRQINTPKEYEELRSAMEI